MIFKAPRSKHRYLFEQAMFETIWIIYTYLSLFFLGLGIKHLIYEDPNLPTFVGAFLLSIVSLILLKKKGRYYLPAIFGVVFGTFFCQFSIFFVTDHSGIADLLWIILISLFAFYSLGSKWGITILILNMCGILWRYVLAPGHIDPENTISEFNTVLNVVISTVSISFLIHRIIQVSVKANRDFQIANIKLQEQNDLVQEQSNEKTVLLQEIHHRVKNNLQVISSLIRLQSYEADDLKTMKLFDSSVNRIAAMALIHEKMYQGENLSKINLEGYLGDLAGDIFRSYSTKTKVNYTIESELEILGNRTIVPLALIFNELITNSLKHAFLNIEKGEIRLKIKLIDKDNFTLDYYDSGVWKNKRKVMSFGIGLIETFTEQLDGEVMRTSNENGTHYFFKLKNID
jgi:two-component sensor histidine kinase